MRERERPVCVFRAQFIPATRRRAKVPGAEQFEACNRGCSPVTLRLRYADGLAMGTTREKHNENCMRELIAKDWWPKEDTHPKQPPSNVCPSGDF